MSTSIVESPNPTTTRSWSPQQSAVFSWAESSTGSALITAVAGAGKTTTLVELLRRISAQGYITALAFNKKAADELKSRLQSSGADLQYTTVGTFHSVGFRVWRNHTGTSPKIEGFGPNEAGYFKFSRISQELKIPREYYRFVRRLQGLAKQYVINPAGDRPQAIAQCRTIIDHFGLETEILDPMGNTPRNLDTHLDRAVGITLESLMKSQELSTEVLDYNDMLYAPLIAQAEFWPQDWVLVDECQDANPARIKMVEKMCTPHTRTVWVGDPAQAIYGFTGAASDSIERIQTLFSTTDLPLTVTYRCPKAVVAEARKWVHHITPADTAPAGEVTTTPYQKLVSDIRANLIPDIQSSAVICRQTRPLIDLALTLVAAGVRCHVEGRDIGEGLIDLATRWKSVRGLADLQTRVIRYRDEQIEKFRKREDDLKAEEFSDTVEALLAIIKALPVGARVDDLVSRIKSLFANSESGSRTPRLTLSTGHKSKGLEWPTVYWLGRDQFQPSKRAVKPWEKEQEKNLLYVMATRAKERLVLVPAPVKDEK